MTAPRRRSARRDEGAGDAPAAPVTRLGVLLESGGHARAHYAFVVAAGAAALGRDVVLFATNTGCLALADPCPLLDDPREAAVIARNVAGIATLRDACVEMGVRMIACEAGLRAEDLFALPLLPGVEVAGIATFLEAVGAGQVVTL